MRYAQLVMGPAGCGKSTYCSTIVKHAETMRRKVHVVNLDPAAEHFDYNALADIRELIHIDDVAEASDLKLGPNGGLVYCLEFLAQNLDWLEEQLGDVDEDYVLFDCPGQIELYTHIPVMPKLVKVLEGWNFRVCGVFVLDTTFMLETSKFVSGALVALSTMINMDIPHVNVLSKMDLLNKVNKRKVEEFLEPDRHLFDDDEDTKRNKKFGKLSRALGRILEDYSLVRFLPLDITDEDAIGDVLTAIDVNIQYGEENEVYDRFPEDQDPEERENGKNGISMDH